MRGDAIHDLDGRLHRLGTTTIPVQGLGAVLFGALSLFWKLEADGPLPVTASGR